MKVIFHKSLLVPILIIAYAISFIAGIFSYQNNHVALFYITAATNTILFLASLFLINYQTKQSTLSAQKDTLNSKALSLTPEIPINKQQNALAIRNSHIGLWDYDFATKKVIYSPSFTAMLGYSEAEFQSSLSTFENMLHPADREKVLAIISKASENEKPYQIEHRLKLKSGLYHWFQTNVQTIKDENGSYLFGTLLDINERIRMGQRLAAQYYLSNTLIKINNFQEGASQIVEAICKTLGWDIGVVWSIHDKLNMFQSIGYWQSSHIKNMSFSKFIQETKLPLDTELMGKVWATKKLLWVADVNTESEFLRDTEARQVGVRSVIVFPIIQQNEVLAVIECFTTERLEFDKELSDILISFGHQIGTFIENKDIQIKLRQNEEYKTAILESASDSIITVDDHGIVISCNPQTENMFGIENLKLIGEDIENIIPGFSDEVVELILKPETDHKVFRSKHLALPAEINISKMTTGSKNRYVVIIRDISEREKTEKLKNEFVSNVSHELRTPLTSIRGALSLVVGGISGVIPPKAKKLLEIANSNCERLLIMIGDILDIEKIESGEIDLHLIVTDIEPLVEETISQIRMYGDKYDVTIKYEHKSLPHVKVNVDPHRLSQVLNNLLSNAIKFSPPGEAVLVSMEVIDNRVRISVSDKGPGIPEEFKARIFQKFAQEDSTSTRKKGGAGLGLTISKSLMEKLHGTINYSTELNKGSTFYIELPIYQYSEKHSLKEIS